MKKYIIMFVFLASANALEAAAAKAVDLKKQKERAEDLLWLPYGNDLSIEQSPGDLVAYKTNIDGTISYWDPIKGQPAPKGLFYTKDFPTFQGPVGPKESLWLIQGGIRIKQFIWSITNKNYVNWTQNADGSFTPTIYNRELIKYPDPSVSARNQRTMLELAGKSWLNQFTSASGQQPSAAAAPVLPAAQQAAAAAAAAPAPAPGKKWQPVLPKKVTPPGGPQPD